MIDEKELKRKMREIMELERWPLAMAALRMGISKSTLSRFMNDEETHYYKSLEKIKKFVDNYFQS